MRVAAMQHPMLEVKVIVYNKHLDDTIATKETTKEKAFTKKSFVANDFEYLQEDRLTKQIPWLAFKRDTPVAATSQKVIPSKNCCAKITKHVQGIMLVQQFPRVTSIGSLPSEDPRRSRALHSLAEPSKRHSQRP